MADLEEQKIFQIEIPVIAIDAAAVLKRVKLRDGSNRLDRIASEIMAMALAVARPRAIYRVSRAEVVDRSTVEIDGVRFTSRALSKCLTGQPAVYPLIATAGHELDELPIAPRDMLRRYCLDIIKTVILFQASTYLTEYIRENLSLNGVAYLNPGEFDDFPISQQQPLFALFNGAEKEIGVTLTSGGAIKPEKSRSGILFPNEAGFLSCWLCTQVRCPGRRAAYHPARVAEYIGKPAER